MKGYVENLKEILTYELKEANDGNLDQKEEKNQLLNLQERIGGNNPKTINPEDLSPFEYSVTERRTRQRSEYCQGK